MPYQQSQVPYQQQYQLPGSPFQQPHQFQSSPQPTSNYVSPVQPVSNGGYNQTLNGMANMSINNSQLAKQDVSLMGQAPLIEDFQHQAPSPTIPLNVSLCKKKNSFRSCEET
jgi:protein transport protein SEC24